MELALVLGPMGRYGGLTVEPFGVGDREVPDVVDRSMRCDLLFSFLSRIIAVIE